MIPELKGYFKAIRIVSLFLLFFSLMLSCTTTIEITKPKPDNCLSEELNSTITSYLKQYLWRGALQNQDTIIYFQKYIIVYFHAQDQSHYFTIFQSPWPVDVLFPRDIKRKQKLEFLMYNINDLPVYIISKKSVERFDLFHFCEENIKLAKVEIDLPLEIYDGSFYPITYNYLKVDDSLIISKLEKPILDFRPGWEEYENNIKRQEEYRLKRKQSGNN